MDLMDKGSHKRAGKRKQQASGPDRLPDSKTCSKKTRHGRFMRARARRRRSRGIRVTKGVKSIKSLEREHKLTGASQQGRRMARNARDPKTKASARCRAATTTTTPGSNPPARRRFPRQFRSTGANTNANAKPFKATKGKFKSASKYKEEK